MADAFYNPSLDAKLLPHVSEVEKIVIEHFRGIQYATIPERFAYSFPRNNWGGQTIDCTRYGPRCPQNQVDISHLLRLPEDLKGEDEEEEDEFLCLNLHLAKPKQTISQKLPVLLWIHGGSQVVTFASSASKCCDPRRIVAESVLLQKPVIVVSINYRLNIFAFGDGNGGANLALYDQRNGIAWVQKHIASFGGDPENITVAGESAGAVYAHAHMFSKQRLKRGILSSGSLYLSPPLPLSAGDSVIRALAEKVFEHDGCSLKDAPVKSLLNAMQVNGVVSMWIQAEEQFNGWEDRVEHVGELLLGDVEYEAIIWRNGIETMSPEDIKACFDQNLAPTIAKLICVLYGIICSRPTSCRNGALDFINDVKFALPVETIASCWRERGAPVYQYLIDEPNPWQSSSRAHHAVDLIFLFGGYDLPPGSGAELIGRKMRQKWISFINGEAPWDSKLKYAFGPFGKSGELDQTEFSRRRRSRHWEALQQISNADLNRVVKALAAGRLSLYN